MFRTRPVHRHRSPLALLLALSCGVLAPVSGRAQDVEAGRAKSAVCAPCHGADGNSPSPLFPSLAGQTARYIYIQLRDFKEKRREPGVMEAVVAGLERADMFDLAAYFAAQRQRSTGFVVDAAKAERGRKKADETLCTMCHLGGLKGQNEIPRLAGQHHGYVVKQLLDFKNARRTNDAGNMSSVSKTLSDQDIDDLGHYIASLD